MNSLSLHQRSRGFNVLLAMLCLMFSVLQIVWAQTSPTSTSAIWAWGDNSHGQFGNGTMTSQLLPTDVSGKGALNGKLITQVAIGATHSLALCSDGTLAAWGYGNEGQLGVGYNTQLLPVEIGDKGVLQGKRIVQIVAGDSHNLALCSDGTLASWGSNSSGQLGNGGQSGPGGSYAYTNVPTSITGNGALNGKTVVQITASGNYNLALCSDGTATAWGANDVSQLGDGTTTNRSLPINITGLGALQGKRVTRLVAGGSASFALCSDGTLATWSGNTNFTLPTNMTGSGALNGKVIKQLVTGHAHTLALCSDGRVVAWGFNQYGQLGNGNNFSQGSPLDITTEGALNGKTVKALAAGGFHSLALCSDGTVVAWGLNTYGQLGNGSSGFNTNQYLPVAIGSQTSLSGKYVTQIAAGRYHSLALVTLPPDLAKPTISILSPTATQKLPLSDFTSGAINGSATDNRGVVRVQIQLSRTRNNQQQFWNGTSFTSTATSVDANLSSNAPAIRWSLDTNCPPPSQLDAGLYQVTASASDDVNNSSSTTSSFTLLAPVAGAEATQTVLGWGLNKQGQLGDNTYVNHVLPTDLRGFGALSGKTVTGLAVGANHTLALCSNGSVVEWGLNNWGISLPGVTSSTGKRAIQVADGGSTSLILYSDGRLSSGPNTGALAGKTVIHIAAGFNHFLALCADGTVATWGQNNFGQLGDGTTTNQNYPVNITNNGALKGKKVVQLAGGGTYSLALCSDGSVLGWGWNCYGQLGIEVGAQGDIELAPINLTNRGVLSGKRVVQLVAGDEHSLALCSDGTVAAWGWNSYGQLGDGTYTQQHQPIAITGNGALKGKRVIRIVAGYEHSLALCSDGTVAAWGYNDAGQLGDGTTTDSLLPVDITGKGDLRGKRVTLIGGGFHHTIAVATILPDKDDKPSVTISSPVSGQSFPISAFNSSTITGTAFDAVNLAKVELRLYRTRGGVNQIWNGTAFTPTVTNVAATTTGSATSVNWTMGAGSPSQSQLDQGTYYVWAYASDGAGNVTSTRNSFTLTAPDTQKPSIAISTPSSGQKLSIFEFYGASITGTASDDSGVTDVRLRWYRIVNGVEEVWDGTQFSSTFTSTVPATLSGNGTSANWSMAGQGPPVGNQSATGTYYLTATITDGSGNSASATTSFSVYNPYVTDQQPTAASSSAGGS